MSLALAEGQSLALLGRNGMGKTTLINSIVGVTRYFGGTIALGGATSRGCGPTSAPHAGIGWVPQERNIFKSLTVQENLTAVARPGPWTTDKVYELFPRLPSAGETWATSSPAASSRCSPSAARWCSTRASCCSTSRSKAWRRSSSRSCWRALRRVVRDEGMSAILVEQNAKKSWRDRPRHHPGARRVVHAGDSAALLADRATLETYLGVTDTGPRRAGRGKR